MRRVLKPDGVLLFCEHGLSPDPDVRRWQHRLTPAWRQCFGGRHLNRPIDELILEQGFGIVQCENLYLEVPRFAGYLYIGEAVKSAAVAEEQPVVQCRKHELR